MMALRRWCALIQFEGRNPIMFGTTMVRHDAPDHEVEQALRSDIGEHLPDGCRILNMVPGALWFAPEETEGRS